MQKLNTFAMNKGFLLCFGLPMPIFKRVVFILFFVQRILRCQGYDVLSHTLLIERIDFHGQIMNNR
jgi:hypothetical protein